MPRRSASALALFVLCVVLSVRSFFGLLADFVEKLRPWLENIQFAEVVGGHESPCKICLPRTRSKIEDHT